jgi:dethiobiotin synthetase
MSSSIPRLAPPPCDRRLVIEGAGGVLVPLAGDLLFADIFANGRFETVVVCARTALGTINHSLLSIEALRARDIPILGIAFVGDAGGKRATIAAIGGVRRLGRLPRLDPLDAGTLASAFAEAFSTEDFAAS